MSLSFRTLHFLMTVTILLLVATFLLPRQDAKAATPVVGWAWSSNIGWIDLSRLTINDDDTVTGWAWSSNVGWIQFGELGNFPGSVPENTDARFEGNDLVGWARACAGTVAGDCTGTSRTDGWDGWIYLGSTGHGDGVTKDAGDGLSGYAWGSNVMGWIRFYSTTSPAVPIGPVAPPPPGGCLSVGVLSPCTNTIRIRAGTTATLYWDTVNTVSCTVSGTNGDGPWSVLADTSGQLTSPIDSVTRYTLTCQGEDGSTLSSSALINIIPEFQEI